MWCGAEGREENKFYSKEEMRGIPLKREECHLIVDKIQGFNDGMTDMQCLDCKTSIKWHPQHSSSNSHLAHPVEDLKAKEEVSPEVAPTFQPEE